MGRKNPLTLERIFQGQRTCSRRSKGGSMNKRHSALDGSTGDRDDFEQINGIGESIAGALVRSGIRRFSELALFTPEELAERIKDTVSIAPVQRIVNDDWIGQARELARKKLKPITPKQLPRGQRELANFLVIFLETTGPEGKAALSTVADHEQSNQSEHWDSIATDALVQWMLERANLPGLPSAEHAGATEAGQGFIVPEVNEEDIELTLSDLWVSQVSDPMQDSDATSQKLVRVEGKLNLNGPDAHNLTYERVPFHINFYLVAPEGNHTQLAATYKWQLGPDALIYTFQQDFPVPKRGRYRLCVSAGLMHPFTAEAHQQGPILQVGSVQ